MTGKIEIAPGVWATAIYQEPDDICELCGAKDELRPYGKRLESGRRLAICFDCAMKDKSVTDAAISEAFDGNE